MNITKMEEFMRENDLMIIERCIENKNEKLDVKEEPFEKLMFFYKSALKQLELQMNIIKDEFKLIYNYDLIDHIDTRIKEPKSIVKKMEKKKYDKENCDDKEFRRIYQFLLRRGFKSSQILTAMRKGRD